MAPLLKYAFLAAAALHDGAAGGCHPDVVADGHQSLSSVGILAKDPTWLYPLLDSSRETWSTVVVSTPTSASGPGSGQMNRGDELTVGYQRWA